MRPFTELLNALEPTLSDRVRIHKETLTGW